MYEWPEETQTDDDDFWFENIFEAADKIYDSTVVPATSGHLRFGAKVASRSRWPLVAGNGNS